MSATSRRSGGSAVEPETMLLFAVVTGFVVVLGVVDAAAHLAGARRVDGGALPTNPFALAGALVRGDVAWTTDVTVNVVVLTGLLAAAALTGWRWYRRRAPHDVDRAGRWMGRSRGHVMATERAEASASRLGVSSPGLPVARTVPDGRQLFSSWEDVTVDIWGPRTGKSTARAIPAILAAPGAVLATSNKRDLVDATRDIRDQAGNCWVFDPQALVGEDPAAWWWNPLRYVTSETRAQILADVFTVAGRTDINARTDAFFEPAGKDLLAALLLAAAVAERPITEVYFWLTRTTDDEPVAILRSGGFPVMADGLQGTINAPDKQRAGVYGTAQQIASFLTNSQAVRWVVPDPTDHRATSAPTGRREFRPEAFVRDQRPGTLYSLSKEGRGSAGPLVTALTVAVTEAAEEYAAHCPHGRLPVPLVAVLDEAANVCRWRELPNVYSHYGSRGIVVMTILQSWSQGVEAWGRDGMRKLWSAANVCVYGGGVTEVEFLEELSRLIGDFDLDTVSVTRGGGQRGHSTNRARRRERILDVADLGALPRGRVIVFASGASPTLARAVPWMNGPHAEAVQASIDAHDPGAAARPHWRSAVTSETAVGT